MARCLTQGREDVLWLNADEQDVRERLGDQRIDSLRSVVGNYKVVVIDEVQRVQNAGLVLKLFVDNFTGVQVIATGSSALEISETVFEPLTGRQFLYHLYPFSLAEVYPRKEVSKMTKLYFWDNGIRNAVIGDFNPVQSRNDIGALWENFIIAERMKINAYERSGIRPYFRRNYNQSEVYLLFL